MSTASPAPYPFDVQLSPFDFTGRVALVTGGSAGIGLGFAKELLKRSCSALLITGRNSATLHSAAASTPGIVVSYVSDAAGCRDKGVAGAKGAAGLPHP